MFRSWILWLVLICWCIVSSCWNKVYAVGQCLDGNLCKCGCQNCTIDGQTSTCCPADCIYTNDWTCVDDNQCAWDEICQGGQCVNDANQWWPFSTSSSSWDPFVPPSPDTTQLGPRIRNGGLLNQQTDVLPNVPRTGQWLGTTGVIEVGNRVMNTIRMTINRFLGLLALIALVLIIRSWFKILIWQDADYEQAKTTLKNAFFGILMIGISWLIVTFLFYIVCVVTEGEYCTNEQTIQTQWPPPLWWDEWVLPYDVWDQG